MAGSRERHRRARDGGQPQGGNPLRELLRQELRAALLPRPRGEEAQRRPEWACAPCGASNWADRTKCRSCGKPKGAKQADTPPTGSTAWPLLPGARGAKGGKGKGDADAKDDGKEDQESKKTERPLAPEARSAELEAQAAALTSSALALRTAGLLEKAKELETEAAALRKRAEPLPPGKRLDAAEGFLKRCEARATKAADAEKAAENALKTAREEKVKADKELLEAQDQLKALRKALAPEREAGSKRPRWSDSEPPADEETKDATTLLQEKEQELTKLREKLRQAEAASAAPPRNTNEKKDEAAEDQEMADATNLENLEEELRKLLAEHARAAQEGLPEAKDPSRLRALADMTERVDNAKRRRT